MNIEMFDFECRYALDVLRDQGIMQPVVIGYQNNIRHVFTPNVLGANGPDFFERVQCIMHTLNIQERMLFVQCIADPVVIDDRITGRNIVVMYYKGTTDTVMHVYDITYKDQKIIDIQEGYMEDIKSLIPPFYPDADYRVPAHLVLFYRKVKEIQKEAEKEMRKRAREN